MTTIELQFPLDSIGYENMLSPLWESRPDDLLLADRACARCASLAAAGGL
jgi:hypothetical protein